MTDLVYIPDHSDRAVDDLLSQYKRKPRIQALVRALAGSVQTVEDSGFDLLVSSTLSAATGVLLDQWGRIVGERRRGLDDADYRRFISARILANLSPGDTDRMIRVFAVVAGGEVRHWPLYPAGFALAAIRDVPFTNAIRDRIRTLMRSIAPAGVGITLIEATPGALQYDSGPGFDVGEYARII